MFPTFFETLDVSYINEYHIYIMLMAVFLNDFSILVNENLIQ